MDSKFQMLVIVFLTLVSTSFQSDISCGNGFLENGEECDCGTKEECKRVGDTCCNYTSCMLNNGAQCTEGVCCSDCRFLSRGTVCRAAVNTCDVPEYCNGASEVCPADLLAANGITCRFGQGYCRGGECRTHNEQCDELWSGGAYKANDACYEVLNLRGDKEGYCKKNSDSTYTACTSKNGQCGKLWCDSTSKITPKDRGYSYDWTKGTLNSKRITCRSVQIYQAQGLPELATVLDGTKCGNQMVCQNNECVSLLAIYGGQRTCANNCNGNGVCNEIGNCHCKPGWKCPNCSEAYHGIGGSSDSGLDCASATPKPCQCTKGACCRNCQIVSKGTVCRDAENSCDVPEYCDGTSVTCPVDLKTTNGLSCKNGQGYCHGGECRTYNEQCDYLWFGGAFKANDGCYEKYNLQGDKHGYCKRYSSSSYLACTSENVQCGKLWCVGYHAITAKNLLYGNYWTTATINGGRITCRSVQIYQSSGKPALGTVLDGTKCGNDKVCRNNKCVALSAVNAGQRKCANNCNGNGVCNENGNCHCNPGWKCPNCIEAYDGPGGSIDNGLSCQAVTPAPPTTKAAACQCAKGAACCKNCQIVARGTVCRDAVNSCDVIEYCDGASILCPADLKSANGSTCKNGQGYCHGGECRTHDEQCNDLWLGGAVKANKDCYNVYNLRGDRYGYCKRLSESKYMACKSKNVQCGKLWCVGNNSAITPKNLGYGNYWAAANLNGKTMNCRSVQIYRASGLQELGTVLDGTKCGDEMVCQNNECVSLSVAYSGQPKCANNCNGNGFCRKNGACHCYPGWKCPNCAEADDGPGGSIDDGPVCQAAGPTTTATKAALTVFSLLLNLMFIS